MVNEDSLYDHVRLSPHVPEVSARVIPVLDEACTLANSANAQETNEKIKHFIIKKKNSQSKEKKKITVSNVNFCHCAREHNSLMRLWNWKNDRF